MTDEASEPAIKLTPAPRDWTDAPLEDLIDHIIDTHHVFSRVELARAERLVATVAAVRGRNDPGFLEIQRVVDALRDDLLAHQQKEEVVLFPYIRDLGSLQGLGSIHLHWRREPILTPGTDQYIGADHDKMMVLLARLRALTSSYAPPPDGCEDCTALFACLQGLEADLLTHIHLENDILLERAITLEIAVVGVAAPPSSRMLPGV